MKDDRRLARPSVILRFLPPAVRWQKRITTPAQWQSDWVSKDWAASKYHPELMCCWFEPWSYRVQSSARDGTPNKRQCRIIIKPPTPTRWTRRAMGLIGCLSPKRPMCVVLNRRSVLQLPVVRKNIPAVQWIRYRAAAWSSGEKHFHKRFEWAHWCPAKWMLSESLLLYSWAWLCPRPLLHRSTVGGCNTRRELTTRRQRELRWPAGFRQWTEGFADRLWLTWQLEQQSR